MVIVVMGVAGCGKSHVGKALADAMDWDFQDGDDLHPAANIEKMRAGEPLDDADRGPWLDRVADWIRRHHLDGRDGIVACSALTRRYRDRLREADDGLRFVFLDVPTQVLRRRLERRQHFMPARLLESQLQTLERPGALESGLTVAGDPPLADVVEAVQSWLLRIGRH
ncbi:MAG: gluconokinase [Rhodanobacter sp.]